MIDVVYINTKSDWKDRELKYSLRSVAKFLTRYRKIVIIGYLPDFINKEHEGILHIPYVDAYRNKARNIMCKVYAAAKDRRITSDFLFMNDDYLLTEPLKATEMPYLYKCDLNHTIKIQTNEYQKHVIPTRDELVKRGLPILNYDIHKPIIYNRAELKRVIEAYDWNIPWGFIMRSIYCNTLQIKGTQVKDDKIDHSHLPEVWANIFKRIPICLSLGERACNMYLEKAIEKFLPEKSEWEI